MAVSAKRNSPPKGKRPAPRAPKASPGPYLRFHHSDALRRKTLSVLATLEGAEDATAHREALTDLVVDLMRSGLDSYFMEPLRLAKAGFVVEQSANLGLAGARQVMGSVIRNIIGRMDGPQLLSVSGSIRRMML